MVSVSQMLGWAMKRDWWMIQVFYEKEYWPTVYRSVDQELEVCSPLEEIKDKLEICDVKLNNLIEGSHK